MRHVLAIIAGVFGLAGLVLLAPPASAQAADTFRAELAPLNGSESSGTATVVVQGNTATVTLNTTSASPGLPHAQHIHIGGNNQCPDPAAAGDDNLISTAEGLPAYGEVQVSLTTEGDVGAGSALAVERFPVATDGGTVNYQRTFELPEGVTVEDIRNGVIVQHGISELFGDEAQYDGEPRSSLDDSLPLEATIPAACGALSATGAVAGTQTERAAPTPAGGVAAGAGGTAAESGVSPIATASAVALLAGAATLLVGSRRMRAAQR